MSTINPGFGRLLAACGGALLVTSLFLDWTAASGSSLDGWQALDVADVFLAATAVSGLFAGLTGGRYGFFRRDLSVNAMADIFAVMSTVLIVWWLLDGVPAGASAEIGAYLGLAGAVAIATGAGDFRVTSWFPRIPGAEAPR